MSWLRAIAGTYRIVQMLRGRRPVVFRDLRKLVQVIELNERQRHGVAAVFGEQIVLRILDSQRKRRMAVWKAA